eukprot:scaffold1062_cov130-Cylindrotheca_fusiformis.AAC.22
MFAKVSRQSIRRFPSTSQKRLIGQNVVRHFSGVKDFPGANISARQLKTTFELPSPTEPHADGKKGFQLTKIVATIGPTSEQLEPLRKVVKAGSSDRSSIIQDTADHGGHVKALQDVRATLLDTRGPEIRCGKLKNDDSGHETISLEKGNTITLQTSPEYEQEGSTENDLFINYAKLNQCMAPGMKVLLDDGAVILTVAEVEGGEHGPVVCSIDNSGELRSRAGVNLPMAETDLPAMSEKDKKDIKYGLEIDVDYVAASFIQSAEGVREIRTYMQQCAEELGWEKDRPLPLIISKIESASALINFDEILDESDGIMVARGDLGVEIPIQQVTNAQKEMVAACNAVGKPVIVATQMLESMAKNPRPTRAEVSDVTNAVYDGADAVMTSGETAKGKYPSETIQMMNDIILASERYASSGSLGSLYVQHGGKKSLFVGEKNLTTAVAKGAVTTSLAHGSKAILVLSEKGGLAALVSGFRPDCPIIAFCSSAKAARQLNLRRGIFPVIGLDDVPEDDKAAVAMKEAVAMGFIAAGDSIIMLDTNDEFGGSSTFSSATVPEEY